MPTISLTPPVAGTVITAGLLATDFSTLQTLLNGGLDNANLSPSAALAVSKLAAGSNGQTLQTVAGVPTWATTAATGYGTALPGSPTDGQEFILVDSTSAPTYFWRFRYNSGSGSTHKWEFVGGSPKVVEVGAMEATSTDTYTTLTTAGPSFTLPKAGDWLIQVRAYIAASDSVGSWMSYDVGGTAANDLWGAGGAISSNGNEGTGSGIRRWDGLAASTNIVSKYRDSTVSTSTTFAYRNLIVQPVRIS